MLPKIIIGPRADSPNTRNRLTTRPRARYSMPKSCTVPLQAARCKQPLPRLQIIPQQFCLPGIAYGLQYTGCRAPQQKGRSQQPAIPGGVPLCRDAGFFLTAIALRVPCVSGTVGRAGSAFCTGRLTVCGSKDKAFFRFGLFIDPHTLFSPLMYSICQIDQRSACLRLRRVTPSSPPMQPQSSTARMRHTTADSAAVPFHTAESTSGAARNVL